MLHTVTKAYFIFTFFCFIIIFLLWKNIKKLYREIKAEKLIKHLRIYRKRLLVIARTGPLNKKLMKSVIEDYQKILSYIQKYPIFLGKYESHLIEFGKQWNQTITTPYKETQTYADNYNKSLAILRALYRRVELDFRIYT